MNRHRLVAFAGTISVLATVTPVAANANYQIYQTDFDSSNPFAGLIHVDYSRKNPSAAAALAVGRSGNGLRVGGGVFEGGTGGTSSNTQYPAVFLKFPVSADATRSFTFTADVRILNEGAFSDIGIFVGRLSAFNANPSFYHLNFNVNDPLNLVYYHADHGNDQRGDRPDGAGELPYTGTPTPVTGTLPSGLVVETWYRMEMKWNPTLHRLSVSLADDAGTKGSFSMVLDDSLPNPNAPSQILNASLPPLVEFGIGTFNDGVVMDNVSISHGGPPPNLTGASTLTPGRSFIYSANGGWMDARANPVDGLVVTDSFLCGKAFGSNLGWVDFGGGRPQNGHHYGNSTSADYGVNLNADGSLEGYAYSANTGWINFEQSHGRPKLDFLTGTISGFAYSGNLGWIDLGSSLSGLITNEMFRPDTDEDSLSDSWEMRHFGNLTSASNTPSADRDGDGFSDKDEFLAGTDPNDPTDYFRILSQTFGEAQLNAQVVFTSSPNRLYRIQHQAGLEGVWTDSVLGLIRPATGSETTANLPLPGDWKRFLRAAAIQPLLPSVPPQ